MCLFFLTIPKPLKQYTLLKKDYPFRLLLSPSCGFYEPEAGMEALRAGSGVLRLGEQN